jgi:hypothetical protein
MLFIPEFVEKARAQLWREIDAGKISREEAYPKFLELDPDDYLAMIGLGQLRRTAGDLAAAEQYFRRAIQTQPCMCAPYVELARLSEQQNELPGLSEALMELGFSLGALDEEDVLEAGDLDSVVNHAEMVEELSEEAGCTPGQVIAMTFRAKRGNEPAAVTERLRQFRLIAQVQTKEDLDVETVDAIIAEGESVAPLLVGVLRAWAQGLLTDDGDRAAENALALLGETGGTSDIPHLLEFVGLDHEDISGAAKWALGRIAERHTRESMRVIESSIPSLGAVGRLAIAELIVRHRSVDPAGKLLRQLGDNIQSIGSEDRDGFFPPLLLAMAASRGREGVDFGRAALLNQGGLLSRKVRRECEGLLAELQDANVPPVSPPPSPFTVYQICSGEASWSEDDEDEDESAPIVPVRRAATPGRNDPCWCNSGKKYKKCHLDSDEAKAHGAPARPSASPGSK